MIETLGYIDAVDYIYLPMAVDRPTAIQFRNKGYCFIHFWDPVAAQSFLNAIHNYKVSTIIGLRCFGLSKDSTSQIAYEFVIASVPNIEKPLECGLILDLRTLLVGRVRVP